MPQILTGRTLLNRVLEYDAKDDHDFSMIIDDDCNPIESALSQVFVLDFPDHCVTCSSLGDAAIHGPYASESEAMSTHKSAELC